jgi:hypothetical protein
MGSTHLLEEQNSRTAVQQYSRILGRNNITAEQQNSRTAKKGQMSRRTAEHV